MNRIHLKATVILFLLLGVPAALFADANSTNHNPPGPQCPNNLPDSEANKPLSATVPPCRVRNISHAGVKIRILKGALRQPTTFTIRPLEAKELPALGGKGQRRNGHGMVIRRLYL